jgi:carbonic anhydrase
MTLIDEILEHNAQFVARKEYKQYETDRFPNKKVAIVTCMDTRLVELLPRAMNLGQGDAKVIKAAGAIVSHPFGSVMRSVIVAVYELGAAEVAVVGHYGCGMMGLNCTGILEKAQQRGIKPDVLATLQNAGIDLPRWLTGFATPEDGVRSSVTMISNHPLLPRDVPVHGLMIDPETGKLDPLINGYRE